MLKTIFMDTWAFLALAHRQDSHHQIAAETYHSLRKQKYLFYTTDYVVDELITLLFRRSSSHEAISFIEGLILGKEKGSLLVIQITTQRFSNAWGLRKKFHDKFRISFTDLTSMVVMNELNIRKIFTDDDHFSHVGMELEKFPNACSSR